MPAVDEPSDAELEASILSAKTILAELSRELPKGPELQARMRTLEDDLRALEEELAKFRIRNGVG
jgi:hypothetical protein